MTREKEIADYLIAAGGAVRLGMELDAEDRQLAVRDRHHRAILALRVDLELLRQRGALDNERVIARSAHLIGAAGEEPLAAMPHRRNLAVHRHVTAHHVRPERLR